MGGFGSGRQFGASCTSEHLSIDARQWQREGLLVAGFSFNSKWSHAGKEIGNMGVRTENGQVRLSYTLQKNGSASEQLNYPVRMQTTTCHYGGVRYWFTCPTVGCCRKVAVLYLGGKYFACRHCYKLAYRSQREAADDRAARRADAIRRRLGWEAGILNHEGDKPKGMHWRTFKRLQAEQENFAGQCLAGIMARFKIKIGG